MVDLDREFVTSLEFDLVGSWVREFEDLIVVSGDSRTLARSPAVSVPLGGSPEPQPRPHRRPVHRDMVLI
jgi:hypothetical protein